MTQPTLGDWLTQLDYEDRATIDALRHGTTELETYWANPHDLIGDHDTITHLHNETGLGWTHWANLIPGNHTHSTLLRWATKTKPHTKSQPAFTNWIRHMTSHLHQRNIVELAWHAWANDTGNDPTTTPRPNDEWLQWAKTADTHVIYHGLHTQGLPTHAP